MLTKRDSLSPNDYGLKTARTGEERFWALYNAHTEASRLGINVNYKGVGNINITIPNDAKWIPLTQETDFQGITITVENQSKNIALFSMVNRGTSIDIKQSHIDGDDFRIYEKINKGTVLLILKDETPWVKNRKGYDYGAIRNEILLLRNGKAVNATVMPWGTSDTTTPSCEYIPSNGERKIIRNLTLVRTATSTCITTLFTIRGQNNVLVDNVKIVTPKDDKKYGDSAIGFANCTNVTLRDVTIDGTYSQKDKYGYGITMNNIWNTKFIRLVANGTWGVFCTNNMNKVILEDCNINRFDIHCYGRDITMKNCTFSGMYNQFSSVYGTIRYEHCIFENHTPYLNNTSYNCFTPFTLEMKDCVWKVNPYLLPAALCIMGSLTNDYNERPELNKRAYPNIYVDGLEIDAPDNYNEVYAIWTNEGIIDPRPVENIYEVVVKNLKVKKGLELKLSNISINTRKNIGYKLY